MYVLLTRLLGTLQAGLTFAVAKIAQRCGVIADWCIRKLTWLLNELQAWLKRTVILMIDWLDHAIMRVLRTLWLLESAFARSAARCLHLCYLCLKLGVFYSPTVACVMAYWSFGSIVWLAVGVCWGVLLTSLLVTFLMSNQENAATIESPDLRWLERIFRYAFRLGPLLTIAIYSYSFQATPFLILMGAGWLWAAFAFRQLTIAPDSQFDTLTEFITANSRSPTFNRNPKNSSGSHECADSIRDRRRERLAEWSKAIEPEPEGNRDSVQRSQADLGKLKERLDGLCYQKELGSYEFESWFYDLMNYFDVENCRPCVADGRQIDGSMTIDGTTYLVELRFTAAQPAVMDIDSILKKLNGKADNTMGLIASMSGFSSVAIQRASFAKSPLLLLDHSHLYMVLSAILSFPDTVRRIRRHSSQEGKAFLPVSDFCGK